MTVVMMQICIAGAPQFSGNRPATHSLFVQDFNFHNCLKSNIGSLDRRADYPLDPIFGVFGSQWRKLKENKKLTHKLKYQHQKQQIALFAFSHSTNC